MSKCSSGCPTQDHPSFADCMRSKNPMPVALETRNGRGFALNAQKAWDAELTAYGAARKQGIQPAGTGMNDIRAALDASDAMGKPYRADE